ncbi:MAG TPA: hypothetical protein EYP89_02345, partial [Candidatus Omnitrophica bacterium]|nr:hypothetical protein [Candidatus Omnitrophota bacterium]
MDTATNLNTATNRATDDFTAQDICATLSELDSDADHGLTTQQATERLRECGANEIEEHEEALWHRLFRRFWGPIPWMIEV